MIIQSLVSFSTEGVAPPSLNSFELAAFLLSTECLALISLFLQLCDDNFYNSSPSFLP